MVIHRFVLNVKHGCLDELLSLAKAEAQRVGKAITYTTPTFGPFDQLVMDLEFENLADQERFWQGWFESEEAQVFLQHWDELLVNGGTTAIWNVQSPDAPLAASEPVKYINRRTFPIRPGQQLEILDTLKVYQNDDSRSLDYRVLYPNVGPQHQMIMEFEIRSLDEYFKAWEDFVAREDTPAFIEKWFQLTQSGGTNELWKIA